MLLMKLKQKDKVKCSHKSSSWGNENGVPEKGRG